MKWGAYLGLALFSTVKFMFAPLGGVKILTFWETYFSCVTGALVCSTIFYFGANYFMKRAQRLQVQRNQNRMAAGKPVKFKKKFTRLNKTVVRAKRSVGIVAISLWAPLFMSIPLGSIVVAKFYRHKKLAFPLIVAGIFLNGFIATSFAYLLA